MNLLDRHIFKSVLFTCIAAIGLFSFVVMLPNVIKELLTPLLAGQLTLATFGRLIGLLFPFAISYALPMGILTGVLLTLGRLSADSEVTAMRAAGLSVFRIARPVFLLGTLCAAVALYINYEAMPWARTQYYREFAAAVRADPLNFIVPRTFIREFKGIVVYVGERTGNILRDVWVWELDDEKRVTSFTRSATGRIVYDEESDTLRLTLTPAQLETRNPEHPDNFEKASIVNLFSVFHLNPIPVGRYLGRGATRSKEEWRTFAELRARQAKLASARPTEPAEAEAHARAQMKTSIILHEKFNLSLAVLSFAFVGVPLGIKVSRRETSANLGVALGLVLGYYILTLAIKGLDNRPELRPDLLLWLPNILFLALAFRLFWRIEK